MLRRAATCALRRARDRPARALRRRSPGYDQSCRGTRRARRPVFACTPDLFPDMLAAALEGRDVGAWAADEGIPGDVRQAPAPRGTPSVAPAWRSSVCQSLATCSGGVDRQPTYGEGNGDSVHLPVPLAATSRSRRVPTRSARRCPLQTCGPPRGRPRPAQRAGWRRAQHVTTPMRAATAAARRTSARSRRRPRRLRRHRHRRPTALAPGQSLTVASTPTQTPRPGAATWPAPIASSRSRTARRRSASPIRPAAPSPPTSRRRRSCGRRDDGRRHPDRCARAAPGPRGAADVRAAPAPTWTRDFAPEASSAGFDLLVDFGAHVAGETDAQNPARVALKGRAKVGRTLTCVAPAGMTKPSYRWVKAGRTIGKHRTLKLRRADGGGRVSCRVTGKLAPRAGDDQLRGHYRQTLGARRASPRGVGAQLLVLDRALELGERALDVAAHDRAAPAAPTARTRYRRRRPRTGAAARPACSSRPRARSRQRPRWSMPGDRVPREVARGLELDDLDQPADLGRADAHEHPVARAEPGRGPPTHSQRVMPAKKSSTRAGSMTCSQTISGGARTSTCSAILIRAPGSGARRPARRASPASAA